MMEEVESVDRGQPPLVSIIVPVYNSEKYVRECVESILQQEYSYIELILVNDGSTDKSKEILNEFVSDKVRVLNTENHGVSHARNVGLELARGEFVTFIDADDWIAPDFVEYMLSIFRQTDSEFVLSLNHFTNSDKSQVKEGGVDKWLPEVATEKLLYPGVTVGCWNKMYNREFLVRNMIFFQQQLFFGEGLRFITDVAQSATSIGVGTRKVYWYRTNTDSCTSNYDVKKALASLNALNSIKENLKLGSGTIKTALNSHFWLNNFLAVRFMIDGRLSKEDRVFYLTCCRYLRSNIFDIYRSKVSLFIKISAVAIFITPQYSARIFNYIKNRH